LGRGGRGDDGDRVRAADAVVGARAAAYNVVITVKDVFTIIHYMYRKTYILSTLY